MLVYLPDAFGGQEKVSDLPGLWLTVDMWVLGIQQGSSARATGALNIEPIL